MKERVWIVALETLGCLERFQIFRLLIHHRLGHAICDEARGPILRSHTLSLTGHCPVRKMRRLESHSP